MMHTITQLLLGLALLAAAALMVCCLGCASRYGGVDVWTVTLNEPEPTMPGIRKIQMQRMFKDDTCTYPSYMDDKLAGWFPKGFTFVWPRLKPMLPDPEEVNP